MKAFRKYLQASNEYLIDRKTWKFVKSKDAIEPKEVLVPSFLWGLGEKKWLAYNWGIVKEADWIRLHNLRIKLFIGGAKIAFADKTIGKTRAIDMSELVHLNAPKVTFGWMMDDLFRRHIVHYNEFDSYGAVPGLYVRQLHGQSRFRCSSGISHEKYSITYRHNVLDLRCYAFLCGTWGILLTDDLQFDSLVAINRSSLGYLCIDKVMYSVNPLLVKASVLLG